MSDAVEQPIIRTLNLRFFKPTGKWYSDGSIIVGWPAFETHKNIVLLNERGMLPGLHSGTWQGFVYVDDEVPSIVELK